MGLGLLAWPELLAQSQFAVLEMQTRGNKYSERAYDGLSNGEAGVINAQGNFASAHREVMAWYFQQKK